MAISTEFRNDIIAAIPSLRAFGLSLTARGDRADDLVQETLMKAWKHHDSFQPGTNMKAWLFTILRNEFYSQIRKRKREVEDADGFYSGKVAVHAEQHGHLDMAEICSVAIGTIKSRVNRARVRLAEILNMSDNPNFGPDDHTVAVLTGAGRN
jgi:RNA polymerase sigma-70 factor, ECF subfamily